LEKTRCVIFNNPVS